MPTVRETCVSQHYGGPIEGVPETHGHLSTIVLKGLRRVLNWASIMPRDASLSAVFSSLPEMNSGLETTEKCQEN